MVMFDQINRYARAARSAGQLGNAAYGLYSGLRQNYAKKSYVRKANRPRRRRRYPGKRQFQPRITYRRWSRSKNSNKSQSQIRTKGEKANLVMKVITNIAQDYVLDSASSVPPIWTTTGTQQTNWIPTDEESAYCNHMWYLYQQRQLQSVKITHENFRVWCKDEFNGPQVDNAFTNMQELKDVKWYWYHNKFRGAPLPKTPAAGAEEPYNTILLRSPRSSYSVYHTPQTRVLTGNSIAEMRTNYNKVNGISDYLEAHYDLQSSVGAGKHGWSEQIQHGMDFFRPRDMYTDGKTKTHVYITYDTVITTRWTLLKAVQG